MRDRVLRDKSLYAFWVHKCHAKAHGAAVILHVNGVAREPQRLGKMIHDPGNVIECVREFLGVGPIAVSEAWVIRRNKVIAVRKTREERLEHP